MLTQIFLFLICLQFLDNITKLQTLLRAYHAAIPGRFSIIKCLTTHTINIFPNYKFQRGKIPEMLHNFPTPITEAFFP